jgi:preprotein translocase subunit SecE
VASDDERDPIGETPPEDSTADDVTAVDEGGDAEDRLNDDPIDQDSINDEVEVDDPAALDRATERVSDADLSEDDELVDEPTNEELAALSQPVEESDDDADRDADLVGVGAPTRRSGGSGAGEQGSKQSTEKKGRPTPKRDTGSSADKRTGPVTFVKESVGELRKVVYPTGPQLLNYFVVVLIFVLFVIAFVSVLDLAFGWAILKVFS